MDKELLKKYCDNSVTDEELNSIITWFDTSSGKPEGKELLLKIWEEISDEFDDREINFELILNKIHHQLNLNQSKILLEKADQDLVKLKRRRFLIRMITSAAAILMLPVLGFGLYMSYKFHSVKNYQSIANLAYNEVLSSVDAITKVTLPDGTGVWLNHSSTLKYPASFTGTSRTVELKGEGFFEVTRNSKMPFVVKAGDLRIVALGTTFNVLAYPGENRIETSLIDGNIELEKSGSDGNIVPLAKMKPKDWIVYQTDKNIINKRIIQDDRYFSWKDGKLTFRKETMEVVVEKLSRWFNVEMVVNDPALLDLTFTGTFVHETLPQVLELLAKVSPINYSISKREELSDGTFSKRKVILRYSKI